MADSEGSNSFMERQNTAPSEPDNKDLDKNTKNSLIPTELLTEFLSCIMIKDYEKAFDYCNQILSFEPDNSTALEFYPLILQKIEMSFDKSTSESSDQDSTSSSGSLENIFPNDLRRKSSQEKNNILNDLRRKFSQEKNNNYLGLQNSNVLDAFNALNISKPKTEITNEKNETIAPSISLHATLENPELKKEQSKTKKSLNESQSPSKQTKKKITSKKNDFSKKVKKLTKVKKEKQKTQENATNISEQKPSSRILLHPTKTMTFPEVLPPQI